MTSHLIVTSEKSAFHPKLADSFSRVHRLPRNTAFLELLPKFNTPATALVTLWFC